MIRAVIFDFGQTLVDSADGFRAAERELQQKAVTLLPPSLREGFLDVYRQTRTRLHDRSLFSRKALLEEVFGHYGRRIDPALIEQWETGYWARIKAMTRPFPETETVLEALLARGYRLALISNTQGQRREEKHRLSNYPALERFFEVIVIAGEAGIPPKPDPAPFCLCLERLAIAPEETVYVGDDLRIDVRGSEAVGMHPLWLRHRSVTRRWPAAQTAAPVIDSLERLLDLESLLRDRSERGKG
ncbi:MAG: HAD family hydrolase [Syntrophales bacterium]